MSFPIPNETAGKSESRVTGMVRGSNVLDDTILDIWICKVLKGSLPGLR